MKVIFWACVVIEPAFISLTCKHLRTLHVFSLFPYIISLCFLEQTYSDTFLAALCTLINVCLIVFIKNILGSKLNVLFFVFLYIRERLIFKFAYFDPFLFCIAGIFLQC